MMLLTVRLKERLRYDVLPSTTLQCGSGATQPQFRVDIGNDHSNEKPSFETGRPGAAGSTAGVGSFATFAPDPVPLAIGSLVKAGASQFGCASEPPGAALFGRICDLRTTSLASMRSGRRWQEQA